MRIAVMLVAAGLLLAACAGQSLIYNNMISAAYRPYDYGYGAGRRDLTTVVLGNPFDIDQAEFETRLVAMLNESPTFLQPTNFTTMPGPSARPQYRAVLLFNRAPALPNQICRNPEGVPVAELGATMRLTAVFCRHGGFLSKVTGELQGVSGIEDQRFRRLIRQMVPLLFPPIDPTRDDDETPFFITGVGWSAPAAAAPERPAPAADRLLPGSNLRPSPQRGPPPDQASAARAVPAGVG